MSNELHTHGLWEALHAITSTAENLLSFCDHPETQPLGDDWVATIRGELEYGQSRCIDGIKHHKTAPIFAALSVDVGRIREWVNTVARDGRELATLLHNRPELSTIRFEEWPPARQTVYTAVHAALRELRLVRDRLAERELPFPVMSGSQQLRAWAESPAGKAYWLAHGLPSEIDAIDAPRAPIRPTHRTEADCPVSVVKKNDGQYLAYRDPAAGWQEFPKRLEPNQAKAIEALCYARQNPESPAPELDGSQKKQLRTLRQDLAPVAPWILPPGGYWIGDPPTA